MTAQALLGPGQIPPPALDDVILNDVFLNDVFLMMPAMIGDLDLTGCTAVRALPDGRILAIQPLMFGCARLCIGRPDVMAEEGVMGGWDDVWDYESNMAALVALASWEPEETPEPAGWHRHVRTGRRRPGGDAAREEVRP